jgi:acyl-coenzyme A thioesterase PaaI-like protein
MPGSAATPPEPAPPPSVAELLLATVPMARTMGIEFGEVTPERAVARLPDQPALHNHVGGPHAGALFTLGESASGAVVLAAFGGLLGRAVPLAVSADIGYRKLARGAVTATAVLGRPAAEVAAELDAGQRPEFAVAVTIQSADGTATTEMTVTWTLRPNR